MNIASIRNAHRLLLSCSALAIAAACSGGDDSESGNTDASSGGATGAALTGGTSNAPATGGSSSSAQSSTGGTSSTTPSTTGGTSSTTPSTTGGTSSTTPSTTGGTSSTTPSTTGGTSSATTGGSSSETSGGTSSEATGGRTWIGPGQGTGGSSFTIPTTGGTDPGTSTGGSSSEDPSSGGTDPGTSTGGSSSEDPGTGGTDPGSSTGGSTGTDPGTGEYDTSIAEGEFSFFVTSLDFIYSKSPCDDGTALSLTEDGMVCVGGLGGDLGGLTGADALCEEAAKRAHPDDTHHWKAFLSTSEEDAIDRIGTGPWYGSNGSLVASGLDGLANQLRPTGDSTTIVYTNGQGDWPFNRCLLDENGLCPLSYGDDHDVLTGSGTDGRYAGGDCSGWTSITGDSATIGHVWPRMLGSNNDGDAHWISTRGHTASGCGRIINSTLSNYGMMGGWGGPGGGDSSSDYGGGVGSDGGYGQFYCFAVSE